MTVFDPEAMLAPLTARANSLKSTSHAPAVLVEASLGGRTATTAVGVDSLATGSPAAANQTFEVGSQTKMMTAALVLMLADAGSINLDAKISKYLPAETAGIANAQTATVREVLEMRSGLPSYVDAVDGNGDPVFSKWIEDHPNQEFGPAQELALARTMSGTDPIGDFHYNNTNYLLLGLLVESITGQDFGAVLKDRIFDPVGMKHTSFGLGPDPLRLSSYSNDTGSLVDVTDALWAPRGESGVTSTTADLIAFLQALLVDKTLLSTAALDQMTDFIPVVGTNTSNTFGLGLFRTKVSVDFVTGFTGGTLGTVSATYHHQASGSIVSVAASVSNADSGGTSHAIDRDIRANAAWAPVENDGSPLEVHNVSAASIGLDQMAGGLCFSAYGATITLDLTLRSLGWNTTIFSDGSVLLVGDRTADTDRDDLGNTLSIPRAFADAYNCDNRLIGLGGDDRLTGGAGDDKIDAGTGRDRISGNPGNDRISGGKGGDVIAGGLGNDKIWAGAGTDIISGRGGRDFLVGGDGHDTFRFDDGDSLPSAPDTIQDFDLARDTIDLQPIDGIAGNKRSAFHWIGEHDFSGRSGELRIFDTGADIRVEGDTDGDGRADVAIVLHHLADITSDHFLL